MHFSPPPKKKKFTPFLVFALKTKAKSTKLTTPSAQISPNFLKNGLLLCLGVHLQLFP